MAVDIVMPQMGESIFEGTITKWLKKPGDKVERDEPLFEISTDKVDAEIPSPSAGVLKEIKVGEGKTVPIQTVVGVIDGAGDGVVGHVGFARSQHRRAKPRVVVRVTASRARGYGHLPDELGEERSLGCAHRLLLAFDLRPSVVAGHFVALRVSAASSMRATGAAILQGGRPGEPPASPQAHPASG